MLKQYKAPVRAVADAVPRVALGPPGQQDDREPGERQGGVSYLREVLDLDPWTGADGEKPTGPVNRAS